MSNFEANFIKYLQQLDISRIVKKRLILFLKDYIGYLKLTFPAENIGNYRRLFTARVIASFKSIFINKHRSLARWQYWEELILSFRDYLDRNENINVTVSENNNNNQELLERYIAYLKKRAFSYSTIRNYKADIKQLFTYLVNHKLAIENITETGSLSSYSDYLVREYSLSGESVKRKISAVCSFLNWLNKSEIKPKIEINKPEISLQERTIKKTVTSFPHDSKFKPIFGTQVLFYSCLIIILSVSLSVGIYRQFFQTVNTSQAQPIEPKRPGRILSFQGRLADKEGTAIIDNVDIRFKIWNSLTGGVELYDSGICKIIPDQNGIFYAIIGSTCGKEIANTVFSENISVYLGITVGRDTEMEPRQQIASVGYALNTETLQGLTPKSPAEVSTIPFINKEGHLLIAAASPLIKSSSGLFTIEGANISIKSSEGSNGAINLFPDGNGSINLNFEGFFPATNSGFLNILGQNMISGNLISAVGSSLTAGYKLIDLSSGNPSSSKFSVDAGGNTVISGSLSAGNSFQSSSSGTMVNSNLEVSGQLFDGGLGVYGSLGNRIPTSINFTKDTVIEFNFKTGTKKIEVHGNINDDGSKYYLYSWDTNGKMNIDKCSPACTNLSNDTLSWTNDTWHDGFISFSGTNLKWSIDKGGKTINATVSSDVPTITSGYLSFSSGFSAINDLLISPTTDLVLTAGHAWIGGRLTTEDNITTTGRIGVGTNNPVEKLDVEGTVEIDASAADYTERLCHSGANGDTNDLKLGDCAESGLADLAEYYGTDGNVSAGDIVAVKGGAYQINLEKSGPTSKAFVTKSSKSYQSDIIGIVSTNPHPEILSDGVFSPDENPVPVALSGRVPVKVTTENGEIKAGDLLTSGTTAGFGMKAEANGAIVGKALENFSLSAEALAKEDHRIIPCPPNTPSRIVCGKIVAFVNVSFYYKPVNSDELAAMTINPESEKNPLPDFSRIIYAKIEDFRSNFKTNHLTSAVIEAENINTQNLSVGFISPLSESDGIKIKGPVRLFGELNAASISVEHASISGNLTSENISTENLTAGIATISGTLFANNIESGDINELKTSFGSLLDKIASASAVTPSPILTADQNPSPSPTPTPSQTPSPTAIPENLLPSENSTESANLSTDELYQLISNSDKNSQKLLSYSEQISDLMNNSPLSSTQGDIISPESLVKVDSDVKFTGRASLSDTSISGQLMIDGTLVLENNRISSLSDSLSLGSAKIIDMMGGKLIVDLDGNLTVKGQLLAEKGITTGEINGQDHHLTINLSDPTPVASPSTGRIGGFGELLVKGNTDIEGELSIWKLKLDSPATSPEDLTLSAAENFLQYNNNSPGLISNRTAGSAVIPISYRELTIYNNSLTSSSLIYITPTSTTQNRTIYIANKHLCPETENSCRPYFTVALDNAFEKDISFNWWIIN